MTEAQAVDTATGARHYHVEMRVGTMTLSEAASRIASLTELIWVSIWLDMDPLIGDALRSDDRGRAVSFLHTMRSQLHEPHNSPVVERIHYHNPLEVWFYVSSGAGAFYVATRRAMSLYDQWQDIRIKRAAADTAESDARRHLNEELHMPPGPSIEELISGHSEEKAVADLRDQIKIAAQGLDRLLSFKEVPPGAARD